jgi:prevent-host-death family protein
VSEHAAREITQRELRNDSGAILRAVADGATFVVTRNGTPVAELHPLRRRTFVPTPQGMAMFAHDAEIDADRFSTISTRRRTRDCSVTDPVLRGLLDTNVVIHLPGLLPGQLPVETANSAITLAVLSAGPAATDDPAERDPRGRTDHAPPSGGSHDRLRGDGERSASLYTINRAELRRSGSPADRLMSLS